MTVSNERVRSTRECCCQKMEPIDDNRVDQNITAVSGCVTRHRDRDEQHQAQEQVRQGKQLVNKRRAPFAPEHIQGKDDRYDNDEFAYQPVGAETPTSGETCK